MCIVDSGIPLDEESTQQTREVPGHNHRKHEDGMTSGGSVHSAYESDDSKADLECDEDERFELQNKSKTNFPDVDLRRSLTHHELKDYNTIRETLQAKVARTTKKIRSCIQRFLCCCRREDRKLDGRNRSSEVPLLEVGGMEASLYQYSGVWRYRRVQADGRTGVLGYMMFFPNGFTCINEQGCQEAGWRFGIKNNVFMADIPNLGYLKLAFALEGAYGFAQGWFGFGRITAQRDCTYTSANLYVNGLWDFVQNTSTGAAREKFQIRFNLAGHSYLIFPSHTRDKFQNVAINGHELVGDTSLGHFSAEFSHDGNLVCAKFGQEFFYGVHNEDGDYDLGSNLDMFSGI